MSILKRGFFEEKLSGEEISALNEQLKVSRGAIVKMTTLAGCGHPGGSLSSLETYTLLWQGANVDPKEPRKFGRDTIVVSHGHTSPGVYAALAGAGFIDLREAVVTFRQKGSSFPGHIEQCVPGVEWDTGNLGQGLSACVGFALADRLTGVKAKVFCVMGDGEQQKGQIAEARRTAVKYALPLVA
ncbi:transketolase, partial [bacterium]|nr:transketolase [bacterium]